MYFQLKFVGLLQGCVAAAWLSRDVCACAARPRPHPRRL